MVDFTSSILHGQEIARRAAAKFPHLSAVFILSAVNFLPFVAGFFMGDGCAYRMPDGTPRISIAQSASELIVLQFLQAVFGGGILPFSSKNPNNAPAFVWAIHGKKAVEFAELVRPFVVKSVKALELDILCGVRNGDISLTRKDEDDAIDCDDVCSNLVKNVIYDIISGFFYADGSTYLTGVASSRVSFKQRTRSFLDFTKTALGVSNKVVKAGDAFQLDIGRDSKRVLRYIIEPRLPRGSSKQISSALILAVTKQNSSATTGELWKLKGGRASASKKRKNATGGMRRDGDNISVYFRKRRTTFSGLGAEDRAIAWLENKRLERDEEVLGEESGARADS